MVEFLHQPMFAMGPDTTQYRCLTTEHVSVDQFGNQDILCVAPEGLEVLCEQAFTDVGHLYRTSHLQKLATIIDDPDASENDRYVAFEMLKNAAISSEFEFPMCQDTGTAVIIGKKGQQVWTGCSDEAVLSKGVFNAYTKNNLRYSQNAPMTLYEEKNTGCNLPAQIELYATEGDTYDFLFIAKGGGSANKTFLFQETKAVLNPASLEAFLKEKMTYLGTAACPPYHLAIVIGGTSAEANLKTVKLASAGYLDGLPDQGGKGSYAFRDHGMEARLMEISQGLGIGAQFGGKHFCLDARVVRMPRHGASCPVGIGVSCSADRNIKAKVTREGIFLENLDRDPARFLPAPDQIAADAVDIDLDQPMDVIRQELSKYPVATRLRLSGKIVVARDIAHAKIYERLKAEGGLPWYVKAHIIYYAGPAKTPAGYASGAFGPTTAARMDPYVAEFQKYGGSLITLAKGNRTRQVTEACQANGGFYLGSIGGPAARLGRECITDMEVLEYPELGMEAVYRITVKDFPAFIIVDDKGNDFFDKLL